MRPLLRPVGPLPAQVYWVRRAVMIVPVVLVVWLATWLVGEQSGNAAGRGDDAAAQGRQITHGSSSTPRSSASDWSASDWSASDRSGPGSSTPGPSGVGSESPKPASPSAHPGSAGKSAKVSPARSATTKPKKSEVAANPAACEPEGLDVGVATALDGPVEAGTKVPLAIVVGNEGAASCLLEVRPTSFRVLIVSGNDQIWDTADCPSLVPARSVVIAAGESSSLALVWPGVRSRQGCPTGQPQALPGYYAAEASVAGVVSPRDRFQLT
jgi:hypothetical protein